MKELKIAMIHFGWFNHSFYELQKIVYEWKRIKRTKWWL